MTRFDVIKQMNIEDLAFFLSIIELGDLNSIPNITNKDINYYINYLKEEDNFINTLHELNKSRHDYKELLTMGKTIEECENCSKDWTKCGTCPVMMQWVKEHKHE